MMEKRRYNNFFLKSKLKLSCSYCKLTINAREYNRHVKIIHSDKKLKYKCIWCNDYKWKRGDVQNYVHRLECVKMRIKADEQLLNNERQLLLSVCNEHNETIAKKNELIADLQETINSIAIENFELKKKLDEYEEAVEKLHETMGKYAICSAILNIV
ncbi:hypothetical protein GpSGHVEth136 [Glossina pallidipes salivary gland hypertrophy virus]|uniref:Uncharacterized protein n=1 Tax=Glossina hytrovirus (isolate Glossina pallidipes/Ethiopia/Seibersdorf/-) TaxID=379529 RepID=A0A0Y0M3L0_GHVS|nr:hypothetical protein GpSGHVEth136 [Glossina pallidipes salivary gland hypertrophy virus]